MCGAARYALVLADRRNPRMDRRRALGLLPARSRPCLLELPPRHPLVCCPVPSLPVLDAMDAVRQHTSRCSSKLVWVYAPLAPDVLAAARGLPRVPPLLSPLRDDAAADDARPTVVVDTAAPAAEPFDSIALAVAPAAPTSPPPKHRAAGAGVLASVPTSPLQPARESIGPPRDSRAPAYAALQQRLLLDHVQGMGRMFGFLLVALPREVPPPHTHTFTLPLRLPSRCQIAHCFTC